MTESGQNAPPPTALGQNIPPPVPQRTRPTNWLGWGLVVLILAVLAFTLDLEEVLTTLARVRPLELGAILFLMTIDRLIMAAKWSMLLRSVGVQLPLATIIRFYYQGTLSGTFLPSQVGGDMLRAYWVSSATGMTHRVFASVVMEKIIGLLAAVTWAIVGVVALVCFFYPSGLWSWIALGIAAVFLANGAFVLSMQPAVHGIILKGLGRWESTKIIGLLHRLYEAYARFSDVPKPLATNMMLTLGEQALQIGIVLLVARSLGLDIEAGALAFLAAAAVHLMIYRIPLAPDNWGVGELTAIGVFGLIGLQPEAAFSLMFLSHILQVVVVLPGLLFLLQRSYSSTTIASSPSSERCSRSSRGDG